jgi:hypothetical protein
MTCTGIKSSMDRVFRISVKNTLQTQYGATLGILIDGSERSKSGMIEYNCQ